ncbi:MAG: DMT family transporter, partial [Comamonadaceae bacterium]
ALAGLVLVVYDSIAQARMSAAGTGFALAALACMTAGAIAQKRIDQPPAQMLPLQYAVSLLLCVALLPLQPLRVEWSMGLLVALLWLGVVISVVATLLLVHMIQSRNLVNVTSLFYLVPAGTALLDWLVFGNRLTAGSLAGMAAILGGVVLVYRVAPQADS